MKILFTLVLIFLFSSTSHAEVSQDDWNKTVSPLLKRNLWKKETAYDSSHYLMVPLHAAFWLEKKECVQDFHDHFRRFVNDTDQLPSGLTGRLNRLQYLFFASRYLVLAQESTPKELIEILLSEVRTFWMEEPAWQWRRNPFPGGIKERLSWKLSKKSVEPSYLRAVVDEELFLIGIAANIQTFLRKNKISSPLYVNEILAMAKKIFVDEISWNESGGWILQPGVWTDHPDYVFAGNSVVSDDIRRKPVLKISWDSSHSHRLPLILFSLSGSVDCRTDDFYFYKKLTEGLQKQFLEKVLVPPDESFKFYRTNNYMDGSNGIYRYSYNSEIKGFAYSAFALSGTPLIGWWAFLFDFRISEIYKNYLSNIEPMLAWLKDIDPYGQKSWIFREHYQAITPVNLLLSMQINDIRERFLKKRRTSCL